MNARKHSEAWTDYYSQNYKADEKKVILRLHVNEFPAAFLITPKKNAQIKGIWQTSSSPDLIQYNYPVDYTSWESL